MGNVHVLYGNEPYIIDSKLSGLDKKLNDPELNFYRYDAWGADVVSFLNTFPVFDDMRIAICRVDTLKSLDKTFTDYLSAPSETAALYIVVKDVDKRTALFKQLQKQNLLVCCDKLTDKDMLMKFLLSKIKEKGGRITEDAYHLLLERERYEDLEEISLYNVLSDIDKLISYNPEITVDTVSLLINENVVSAPFGLAQLIQEGNTVELRKQAEAMKGDEIKVLSALLREYRIAWKSKFFSPSQIGAKYISLKNLPKNELSEGMRVITDTISGIKNSSMPQNFAMMFVFEKLIALHRGGKRGSL